MHDLDPDAKASQTDIRKDFKVVAASLLNSTMKGCVVSYCFPALKSQVFY